MRLAVDTYSAHRPELKSTHESYFVPDICLTMCLEWYSPPGLLGVITGHATIASPISSAFWPQPVSPLAGLP